MPVDLSDEQWDAVRAGGTFVAPDGMRFARRSTRAKRRTCDELIAAGSPLVLFYWAGDQLDWHDGDEASEAWAAVRSAVTSQEPRPRGDLVWTAGIWEDDSGRAAVLLTGHC